LRAALVRTETLAQFAREAGLGEALLLGRGEEEAGGRERIANLCDAFEAVVGALYLDGGLEAVEAFVEPLVKPAAKKILASNADQDAKSSLQEWSQAKLGTTPRYRIVSEQGPDHAKVFVAEVLLRGEVAGSGVGHSKQSAEQAAAEKVWRERHRQQ
jgi:ribonuclease-3